MNDSTKNNIMVLCDHVAKREQDFSKSLPAYIPAERFVRTAQSAIAHTRNIEKVSNPLSLLSACAKAAADGLILDGREAALVVDYRGEVQYRPMMRGLLKLAHNSGQIKSLVVELVRDADTFDYSPTRANEPIRHEIDMRKPRGDVFAVYALASLMTGGIIHEVMTVEDVNRIRDRSDAWKAFAAKKISSTPWQTDWSEMARKTVFRRLSKYLPSSTDRDALHNAVERIDEDYTPDAKAGQDDAVATARAPAKKRGAAAAVLNQPREDDTPPHDPQTGEIIDIDDYKRESDDI